MRGPESFKAGFRQLGSLKLGGWVEIREAEVRGEAKWVEAEVEGEAKKVVGEEGGEGLLMGLKGFGQVPAAYAVVVGVGGVVFEQ